MTENKKIAFNRVLRSLISLSLGGVLIGLLHDRDMILTGVLFVLLIYKLIKEISIEKTPHKATILITGTLISALLGVAGEVWGIQNDYWTYHDLSGGRAFPYWLPIAWAFTFVYFYRFEKVIFTCFQLNSLKEKLVVIALIYTIFPALGEVITINMGVWTYSWGIQVFGVPLLAIFLLVFIHSVIFALFTYVIKKKNIANPVFNNVFDPISSKK